MIHIYMIYIYIYIYIYMCVCVYISEQPRPSRGAVIAVGAVDPVGMMYKSSNFRISSLVEICVI